MISNTGIMITGVEDRDEADMSSCVNIFFFLALLIDCCPQYFSIKVFIQRVQRAPPTE